MAPSDVMAGTPPLPHSLAAACRAKWGDAVVLARAETAGHECLLCSSDNLRAVCFWLTKDAGYQFATLVAEEAQGSGISLRYIFCRTAQPQWLDVLVQPILQGTLLPSISDHIHAADWHEREIEDLFGVHFEGHPRLGEFVLHEHWPEGVNPMRRAFDARQKPGRMKSEASWEPPTIVTAPGAFAMPVGPVFSDFAEAAHFLLETVGEDVIHTIPRFFYKYRGVEKIAEGQPLDRVLLLAERFSGTTAFAHGLAFCQAVEAINGVEVPRRAKMLRTAFCELERLRHHAAAITGICGSTALVVAASQAAIVEEELLRLSGAVAGHRYLFGLVVPGGLARDLSDHDRRLIESGVTRAARQLHALNDRLRVSSSFLDRLEEVGTISLDQALVYGLVGPVARASGVRQDMRSLFPYAAYGWVRATVPTEQEGDGYARLRILFQEAEDSAAIIRHVVTELPVEAVRAGPVVSRAGAALSAVEAPLGAAFHWVRTNDAGVVERYRIAPPSFTNWHAFPLAAENFAFQDFPIILASFGLSNAECDR